MNETKIKGLFESPCLEDILIALNLLIYNYTTEQIISFFNNYGKTVDLLPLEDIYTQKSMKINIPMAENWKYYYKGEVAFYVGENTVQLYKHPNYYKDAWNPTEL